MSYRGGETLRWKSDFAQFYLVDDAIPDFDAPVDITHEMIFCGWHPMPGGLAIYTNDCLHQLIEIRIFSAPAAQDEIEWRSGRTWTKVTTTSVLLPSKQFVLSSPSRGGPAGNYGPIFRVDAAAMVIRIHWMEFQGSRDDTKLVEPDVIRLDFWPA
jgi:hypothetical protein